MIIMIGLLTISLTTFAAGKSLDLVDCRAGIWDNNFKKIVAPIPMFINNDHLVAFLYPAITGEQNLIVAQVEIKDLSKKNFMHLVFYSAVEVSGELQIESLLSIVDGAITQTTPIKSFYKSTSSNKFYSIQCDLK